MQDLEFKQVLYKKRFSSKAAAENFINSHKRREFFELLPASYDFFGGWIVEKTRPATQAEIDALFSNLGKY